MFDEVLIDPAEGLCHATECSKITTNPDESFLAAMALALFGGYMDGKVVTSITAGSWL